MTIDETPGKGTPPSSAHEIERYGGLFARRTRGMTSSAMRDMMAVTARPEEAQDLPTHRGFRGTLETHAKRTGRRWKRRLGR